MPEGIPYASTNVIAGAGLDLNYVGRHCFAYSGGQSTTNSAKTVLSFQTGNKYIEGLFEMCGGVNYNAGNLNDGTIDAFRISLNGVVVAIIKIDMIQEDMPTKETFNVILPPYTVVLVECLGSANASSELTTTAFTGKLYK